MFSRRQVLIAAASVPLVYPKLALGQTDEMLTIMDETYPPLDDITSVKPFGSYPPGEKAVKKAKEIADAAPNGDDPLRIVRYFITLGKTDPGLISQTPKDQAWNPLILEFFKATDYKAENDMVPWCAAFMNWTLARAGRKRSGQAASQSFLDKKFAKTDTPTIGDIAVFTCYDVATGKSVGLGHVSFVAAKPQADKILVAGGNQTNDGHSMICEKYYPLGPVKSSRTINGKKTPVIFKINTYVKV